LQTSEIGSQIAVLGNEIANAVLTERSQAATLRIGELGCECIPAWRARGDDDVSFARRSPLLTRRHPAGAGTPLRVVKSNQAGEIRGPGTAIVGRAGESGRQTCGELRGQLRASIRVEGAAPLHKALEDREFLLGERRIERGRWRLADDARRRRCELLHQRLAHDDGAAYDVAEQLARFGE